MTRAAPEGRPRSGNLPVEVSSFIGRAIEVAEAAAVLARDRMVTLTGIGGVGKTRIALRVARDLSPPAGAWLVSLSELEDPELLTFAVAQALGVRDETARPHLAVLAEFLHHKELLLVLDTCEHLREPCAGLAGRLLLAAPGLRILATSREPLRAAGERVVTVPPLPVDSPTADGVQLFIARATAAAPGFELRPELAARVAQLCRRLDGIPLAIELAAARVRTLSVEQIAENLDADRFTLLAGNHGPSPRHRDLRTTIGWSYRLCEPAQRLLWNRLSVCAGGFDLAAARGICADERLPDTELGRHLVALITKSIVDSTGSRYRMLDSIRAYGLAQLAAAGEEPTLRRRHRDWYAALARQGERAWAGPKQLYWSQVLRAEHGNLRAALDYCLREPDQLAAGQHLAAGLWYFWLACGLLREGRYYLERALVPGAPHGPTRHRALWTVAMVAAIQGDLEASRAYATACTSFGDPQTMAAGREALGLAEVFAGDLNEAVSHLDSALAYHEGRPGQDLPGLLRVQASLCYALAARGDTVRARQLAVRSRAMCRARGEQWQMSYVDYLMGILTRAEGDLLGAATHLLAALGTKHLFHDVVGLVMSVEELAATVVELRDGEGAGTLLGACANIWLTFGLPLFGSPLMSTDHERTERAARDQLGAAGYGEAYRAGRELDIDDLVAYARGRYTLAALRRGLAASTSRPLTERETQIADLLGQGLSTRDMARRLRISVRTVEAHIAHIRAKLGFANRARIAAWGAAGRRPSTVSPSGLPDRGSL